MDITNQTDFHFSPFVGRVGFPKHSLTLIVKGTFDLLPGQIATIADGQLFPTGDELCADDDEGQGSCRYESDFAYYKPCADLLLTGKCHSPGENPVQACRVTFQVGSNAKTLGIFGNRYWKEITRTISDPEPFTEMELRYENSFGGDGYEKNPVGKGYGKIQTETGSMIWPLPNIEDLRHLIDSPGSHPEPVGLGPLGKMWQQRFSKLGTYKGDWLKERWPWFPKDFDWGYFNAATLDMQVEGYLKGDESLYFENLHPAHSEYHCRLPGLRVRCFLNESDPTHQGRTQFDEIALNLDTLWVDMESEKLVLVWRGVTSIQSEEYEEIQHVFIVSEKLEERAQPVDYYHDVFQRHLAEEDKPFEIESPETETADETIDIEKEIAKAEEEIARAEEEVRAALIAGGIDPDIEVPPPSEEDKEAEARMLKELGIREEEEAPPITRKIVHERITRGEGFAGEDLRGIDLSGLDLKGIDFQKAILAGVCLKNADLSGARLAAADFGNADLSGSILENADTRNTDFTEADFTEANLTGAVIEDAVFEKANMQKTVLDQVSAKGAFFSEADLSYASLKEGVLDGADFSKSILRHADFQGASLKEASVEGAVGLNINMAETDLTELRASERCNFAQGSFRKAIGVESIWENANLKGADFSYSKMLGADFTSACLEKANFFGADMKQSRFTKANMKEAKCISMNLFEGSLEKADLTGTDFSGSNLYGVEFLDSTIETTKFKFTNLRMTKLKDKGTGAWPDS